MKRLIVIAGFCLGLSSPLLARADMPAECAGVQGATAISPYVERTLDRAREGLRSIEGSKTTQFFDLVFPAWVRSSAGAVAGIVDMHTGVMDLGHSLRETTTCEYLDQLQIECALAQAREALLAQIGKSSFLGVFRAQTLIQFLHERWQMLQAGALDGTYLDATALQRRLFDTKSFGIPDGEGTPSCGDGKIQKGEECDDGNRADGDGCSGVCFSEMCPFSSDYGEAVPSLGMGCDLTVLATEDSARANATTVIAEETRALRALLSARAELLAAQDDPPHVAVEGCVRGWCEADTERPCGKSADCGEDDRCIFGRRVCAGKPTLRCSTDDACGSEGPCTFVADTRAAQTPRGPFALEPDEMRLTRAFLDLWGRQGERRAWPEAYRNPEDYPPSQRKKAQTKDNNSPGGTLARAAGRMQLRLEQRAQGVQEGVLFAAALDGHLRMAEELQPLRSGVRRLGLLARDDNGVRLAARNLAYYILRTCIYRPCNEKLKAIIGMTFAEECYPYTNGEYLDGDAWQACIAAAGE